jgi:16S rRNA (cytosine967-C5)-methyltransferase
VLSARTVAARILSDIERNSGYSNIAIDSALNDAKLSKQDSALVSMLVYGVLQRKITLE